MNLQFVDVSGNCPYSCTWNGKKLILDCPTLNVQAKGYNEYELAQNLQGELKRALEKSSDFQRLVKLLPYVKCTDCVSSGVNRPIQTDATTAAGIADEIAKRIYEKLLFNIGEHRLREAEDYLAGQRALWEAHYIWNPPLKFPRHADESNKDRYDPKLELLKWQTKKNHQEWLEKQKQENQEAAGDTVGNGAGVGSDDDNYVPPGSPIRTADCLIAVGEQFKNAVAGWLDKRKEDPAKFEKSKHDREEIIKKELERFAQQERERLELEQKLVKMLAPSPGVSFEEAVALWEKAWQERLQGTQGDLYAKALADLMQKLQEKNATPEQTLRAKKLLLASLEHFVARNDDEYLPADALNLNLVDEALELGMCSDDPVQSWLQVLGRALLNFVPSAAKLVAGIAELLKSPGATLEALCRLILGYGDAVQGLDTENAKLFNAALDALMKHFSRYTSIEGLKEAIAKDPVGVVMDVILAVQIAKTMLKGAVAVAKDVGETAVWLKNVNAVARRLDAKGCVDLGGVKVPFGKISADGQWHSVSDVFRHIHVDDLEKAIVRLRADSGPLFDKYFLTKEGKIVSNTDAATAAGKASKSPTGPSPEVAVQARVDGQVARKGADGKPTLGEQGERLDSFNQRSQTQKSSSEPVPASKEIQEATNKTGKTVTTNSTKDNLHAEPNMLIQLGEAGLIKKGSFVELPVVGKKSVCDLCQVHLPIFAENYRIGFLTVLDKNIGVIYYWRPGMKTLERLGTLPSPK